MNSYSTDIIFSKYYNLQSVHFDLALFNQTQVTKKLKKKTVETLALNGLIAIVGLLV